MKKSRHLNYQSFKDSSNYKNSRINLDQIRFDWVKKIIINNYKIKTLTDIGSNLGYICIKFNKFFNTKSLGYEYEKQTFLKARKIKGELKNVKYLNKGLNIKNLRKIKKTDLIANLNVLHHAGHMYDKHIITDQKQWKKYSVKYLKILSKKSKFLFFQTGNVNYGKNYFKNIDTFKILPQILKKSGWKILKIGAIDFKGYKVKYKTYNLNQINNIPLFTCIRDKKSKKVFYYNKNKIVYKFESGFLQRPLFWCISNNK